MEAPPHDAALSLATFPMRDEVDGGQIAARRSTTGKVVSEVPAGKAARKPLAPSAQRQVASRTVSSQQQHQQQPPQSSTSRRLRGAGALAPRPARTAPPFQPVARKPATGALSPVVRGASNVAGVSTAHLQKQRLAMKDMKAELEKIRKETVEMKAAEAGVKAKMKREEEAHQKAEKEKKQLEELQRRKREEEEMKAYCAEKKKQQHQEDLDRKEDFISHVKQMKVAEHQQELACIHDCYLESKEASQYNAEWVREKRSEEQWLPIEENIEKYSTLAAARKEERQRVELEEQEEQALREKAEMEHLVMLAQQERDRALESLDFVRYHEQAPVQSSQIGALDASSHEVF